MNTASAFEALGTLPFPQLQTEQFRLVKTSCQGCSYYFKGGNGTVIHVAGGGTAYIANTGLLPGDAFLFPSEFLALQIADALNAIRVSNARWIVEPVQA